jgi:hypothetical protein
MKSFKGRIRVAKVFWVPTLQYFHSFSTGNKTDAKLSPVSTGNEMDADSGDEYVASEVETQTISKTTNMYEKPAFEFEGQMDMFDLVWMKIQSALRAEENLPTGPF